MTYGPDTRVVDLLADPDAAAVVRAALPGELDSPAVPHMRFITLGLLTGRAELDPTARESLWSALAAVPDLRPPATPEPAPIAPDPEYDGLHVAKAIVRSVGRASVWGVAEVVIDGPSHGNPFVDVDLAAEFESADGTTTRVGGFYDGDGVYRIRYQPQVTGRVRVATTSTARSLDGLMTEFEVHPADAGAHGPVGVADTFHFAHRDGTRFLPLGTTAYAWTSQSPELEERTLATLETAPFRKLRMCVFPKSYIFNTDEPPRFAFERAADGEWDYTRFDPEFFAHLERRIEALAALGIEADLILFHPYDRWGFSEMGRAADDRYTQYIVRRLSAFANVWWSLANEYDLMLSKSVDDWERIAAVIAENDPVGHLTSIHNCFGFYDHSRPWITHCSVQRQDVYRTAEYTDEWRERYGKPIVIDECAYEGDIDQGWGNISGEEMTRRAWEGALRGGYVGHGETYLNDREELWWSKGGELVGDSPSRMGFLLRLTEDAPGGVLEPLPGDWDVRWGGTESYRLGYFGFGRPRYRDVVLPRGTWSIDVIDTWGMTIEPLPGVHSGLVRVDLPGREFMALRLRRTEA